MEREEPVTASVLYLITPIVHIVGDAIDFHGLETKEAIVR